MSLPLSKTLDPSDYDQLQPELAIVDRYFTSAREQHPQRKWEYCMALRAISTWLAQTTRHPTYLLADVGGAGSPFWYLSPEHVTAKIIDPDLPDGDSALGHRCSLAEKLAGRTRLRDIVVYLSVLEHVEDLDQFLYHLSCLVAPGGLLFLTVDYCDDLSQYAYPIDTFHFHWMRKRIFNAYSLGQSVSYPLLQRDFAEFGGRDLTWHGPQVFNYTFASLALVKRS